MSLLPRNPKPGTAFCRYNGRLALFREVKDNVKYWREYWSDEKRAQLTKQARLGELYDYEAPVRKYVPRELPVLEAGCGPAHLVAALVARGYKGSGVDFEPEVVKFVNKMWPLLNVVEGDVRKLDAASGSIGCYLSGGVVEHFPEGPAAALREARRVLHPKGVALIQVPYLNPGRAKLLQRLTEHDKLNSVFAFHQFYFGVEEFKALLLQSGLQAIEIVPCAVEAFMVREHPIVSRLWRSSLCREKLKKPVREWFRSPPQWFRRRAGHMMLTVSVPV